MVDFLEKITGSIDKGIKTVSSKGKAFLETTKLKGEIRDVQNSIENRFQTLGKKVFEMLNRGALNEDELQADYKEITSLFKRVTELENALKEVELEALRIRYRAEVIVCPKCGGHNKSDAKFCMSCGSAMVVEAKVEGKACPTCNAPVK
ncbi:MAG: zinc ribbon domain-containing protein, partial [Nitrospirota bacterium]